MLLPSGLMGQKSSRRFVFSLVFLLSLTSFVLVFQPFGFSSTSRHLQADGHFKLSNSQTGCDPTKIGVDWPCLKKILHGPSFSNGSVIIVNVNQGFLTTARNLICTAEKAGISRNRFLMWSMDAISHNTFVNENILSIYNPLIFPSISTKEVISAQGITAGFVAVNKARHLLWRIILSMDVPFWWIDADVVIHNNIDLLLKAEEAAISDAIFSLDLESVSLQEMSRKYQSTLYSSLLSFEANAGIFYVKSTKGSKRFFQAVADFTTLRGFLDQQSINVVLRHNLLDWIFYVDPFNPVLAEPIIEAIELGQEEVANPFFHFTFFNSSEVMNGHALKASGDGGLEQRHLDRINGYTFITHANGVVDKNSLWKIEGEWCL